MIKNFMENTIEKTKEDVTISNGLLVFIAVISFLVGLVIGIVCTAGVKSKKSKKTATHNTDIYDYNFELDEDYDDEDYAF